jgi:hypothetical protein
MLQARIGRFETGTRRVLRVASVFGDTCWRGGIQALLGGSMSDQQIESSLELLLREEILEERRKSRFPGEKELRFRHALVREGAYALLIEQDRALGHKLVGEWLEQRGEDQPRVLAEHFDRGKEPVRAAGYYLRAGQQAKTSTAYREAIGFLKAGQALLGDEGWAEARELMFELHLCLAEATTLAGQGEEGNQLFELCIERAEEDLERARMASLWLPLLRFTGQFAHGIEVGLRAVAWLGRELPRTSEEQETLLDRLMSELEPAFSTMSAADWAALSRSTDRVHELRCSVLATLGGLAASAQTSLYLCCSLLSVQETLCHGITSSSLPGFSSSALYLTLVAGKVSWARELNEAALDWLDRQQHNPWRVPVLFRAAMATGFYISFARARELFVLTVRLAEEEGNLILSVLVAESLTLIDMLAGSYLPEVARCARAPTSRGFEPRAIHSVINASLAQLMHKSGLSDGAVEQALTGILQQVSGMPSLYQVMYRLITSFVGFHLGADVWAARTVIHAAEPRWKASLFVHMSSPTFFLGLIAVAHSLPSVSAEEHTIWEEKLTFFSSRLSILADSCPETFRHMFLLVLAGRARSAGELERAERLYAEAIAPAHQNGFGNNQALGLRLLGELALVRGMQSRASAHLHEAHDAYLRWGAFGAAAQIRARYAEFFPADATYASTPDETTGKSTISMPPAKSG